MVRLTIGPWNHWVECNRFWCGWEGKSNYSFLWGWTGLVWMRMAGTLFIYIYIHGLYYILYKLYTSVLNTYIHAYPDCIHMYLDGCAFHRKVMKYVRRWITARALFIIGRQNGPPFPWRPGLCSRRSYDNASGLCGWGKLSNRLGHQKTVKTLPVDMGLWLARQADSGPYQCCARGESGIRQQMASIDWLQVEPRMLVVG